MSDSEPQEVELADKVFVPTDTGAVLVENDEPGFRITICDSVEAGRPINVKAIHMRSQFRTSKDVKLQDLGKGRHVAIDRCRVRLNLATRTVELDSAQ